MKTTTLCLLLVLLFASTGHAYYQAEQGRWLNRDPIGERGGINVYAYIGNKTIDYFDILGMGQNDPPSSVSRSCCNGKIYDKSFHCCCNDIEVVSRTPIDSGVTVYYWEANTVDQNVGARPVHVWIEWGNGGSIDSNGLGDRIIHSPAVGAPFPDGTVTSSSVALSPCKYDFNALMACLSNAAEELDTCSGPLCNAFAESLIGKCKKSSRGCTTAKKD